MIQAVYIFLTLIISFSLKAETLDINFVASVEFQQEALEYESIWNENKDQIVELMESYSKLKFKEDSNKVKAILVDGPSHSGYPFRAPMRLRYNYSSKVKLASLIHELGHRLIINVSRANSSVDSHSILFLFLYDVWVDLRGEAFANKMVEVEKTRGKRYLRIWNEVLALSKKERNQKYLSYL